MLKKMLLIVPVVTVSLVMMAGTLCHSQEFWLAQKNLKKMVLTPAQTSEIAVYEKVFQKRWSRTHRTKGCSHHEAHADWFVAAAAGVLTENQFKKFRGRDRNVVETVGYDIRQTGEHIGNLLTIAKNL